MSNRPWEVHSDDFVDSESWESPTGLPSYAAVTILLADINTESGRAILVAACPDADILVNNNEGPPPGRFAQWQRADFQAAIDGNFMAPVFMIQALIEGMKERRFGRIGKYRSDCAVQRLVRHVAPSNVTINNMLAERFDTDRQRFMAEMVVKIRNISREEAIAEIHESIAAKRMGLPTEFGYACSFLCSAWTAFASRSPTFHTTSTSRSHPPGEDLGRVHGTNAVLL
jgi:3-oxoacyl-[acyl-carrier protein] reductase